MAKPLRFHPRFPRDLQDAVKWYDAQSTGIGNRFRATVDRGFDEIERFPLLNPRVGGDSGIRFRRVGKFPYLLLYRIVASSPEVLRLVHSASDPANWLSGLEET